jgi:predicted CoA-substrate-specific enzyme activase
MFYTGIDIGSTASKVVVFNENELFVEFVLPTGWNSKNTADLIYNRLKEQGIDDANSKITATGYGRVSVPYAHKTVTEITCHGKGAYYLFQQDCTVIDIGGQDTKIITISKGNVTNFTMNDKCAAGTGRFLELMANTLGVDIMELCTLSEKGQDITISSMCTVFAESEVISLIGSGKRREDIASGVLDSITSKVKSLCQKHSSTNNYFLTGGLCENKYVIQRLSQKLGKEVQSHPKARFAGAIGAAIVSHQIKDS